MIVWSVSCQFESCSIAPSAGGNQKPKKNLRETGVAHFGPSTLLPVYFYSVLHTQFSLTYSQCFILILTCNESVNGSLPESTLSIDCTYGINRLIYGHILIILAELDIACWVWTQGFLPTEPGSPFHLLFCFILFPQLFGNICFTSRLRCLTILKVTLC